MLVDQPQIDHLRQQFASLQSKADLLALLNEAKAMLFEKGDQYPLQLTSLTWYANTSLGVKRYTAFEIPKKRGGHRLIFAPKDPLKVIQRCLNLVLQCVFSPHKAATGFVPGKSITDNARPHVGKHYVYNLDLKDFFTSVDLHRVKACLKLPPFNLTGDREPLAFLIANLCCIRQVGEPSRAFLPQGAPTSPLLTNVVCQQLDRRLTGLAKRFGATYTRYADDMTFSSFVNIYQPDSAFCVELNRIITDQRFVINPAKTRLQRPGYRQEVTGLVVNERVNVPRRFWREIRALLHNWETLDYDEANTRFQKLYALNKARPSQKAPALANVLSGKLLFMKMVRGANDELYQHYARQLDALTNQTTDEISVDVERILDIWEKQGLEKAMTAFEQYKDL
ncbi:MAG: RNA-directed DNA polymerase [Spirosoma sp.]|nr:RNA-directed DNA polymerase [Spirosoma sp.]